MIKRIKPLLFIIVLIVACGPLSTDSNEEQLPAPTQPVLSQPKEETKKPPPTETEAGVEEEAEADVEEEAIPTETEEVASDESRPAPEIDKWSLWVNGPHLRGANIWQAIVVPELDGLEFKGDGRVGPPYTQEDFNQLAAMGANYVSISGPGLFTETPPYTVDPGVQENLDNLLAMIAEADMFATIGFRTGPGRSEFNLCCGGDSYYEDYFNDTVWQDQAAQDAWVEMWRYTAQRYGDNPVVAGYKLMVEPNSSGVFFDIYEPDEFYAQYAGTLYDWNQFYPRLVAGIREVDSNTPILVGGNGWSGVAWLPYLQPTDDPRTVYVIHQYEPQDDYTHQEPDGENSYPGVFDVDGDGEADQFDRAWLENLLSPVDEFAATRNVPVAVDEYGVVRWVPGAAEFMDDQMDLFEQRGMNYAVWEWQTSWKPFAEDVHAFDFRLGPAPDNRTEVASSELMGVITKYWARNTIRPSNLATEASAGPSPGPSAATDPPNLADVADWFYMINVNLEPEMVEQIVDSEYDMVVLDFIPSEANNTDYPMAEVIEQLHNAPQPKLVIAYIDIGQAEDFRTYWQPGWGIGNPEWIVATDPDGWEGNYPVAYWNDAWRDIWLGENGYLQAILEAGFDGVYLDWVEAYSDENVVAAAEQDGTDPRQEMIWWVGDIAEFTQTQNPDFIIIAQNAAELAADDEYLDIIDAIAQEQVWFDGSADNDPPGDCPLPRTEAEVDTEAYRNSLSPPCREQYDEFPDSTLHVSSQEYLRYLTLARDKGEKIFTIDYALEPENVAWIYETSRGLGFVPFAGNRALDQFVEPHQVTAAAPATETAGAEGDWWQPAVNTTWQWQLEQPIDPSFEVDMYDIEMFDNDADTVADLHAQGRKVICYISVGSWEEWRPDADQFPAAVIGNDYGGWPGEKWLDIRQIDLLAPIMRARLDECRAKGFDGIEPDNIDGYTNDTGFPLTYDDQLTYNIWLANEAHARGLSIGLKNDSEQVADLLPHFDWALTEDCFAEGWCAEMLPFIEAGKPVFAAEYTDMDITPGQFCPQAQEMNFSAILKNRNLDAWREACPSESQPAKNQTAGERLPGFENWLPPQTAAGWLSNPIRGTVIEIGYGGPDEYNDPPYPSVENLQQLRDLGARVVALEFQYAWSIEPPYQADESQFDRITAALDNVAAAGLYAVVSVRNGPGRNAMMPGIADDDVITTFYQDETAQAAYQDMLRDVVSRFKDRPEIIAWEPLVEPAPDAFLTHEDAPFPRAAALWNDLAPDLIAAIRDEDPNRPILIEPVNWGGPEGFIELDRFDDDNIIYSLHTYEPFAYTHQETPPYAAYPGQFDGEYFDRAALDALLEPVDDFQTRFNVPLVVGEWGGIRWLPGMEQYIAGQRSLFEARGWSWFWYAWDDEEWDELGFELHMGPNRNAPAYNPDAPAFGPIVDAWQLTSSEEMPASAAPALDFAYETRPDGAVRLTDPPSGASDQNPAFSPDGKHIIFTRFENGYNQGPAAIYLLDLTGGEITLLTTAPDSDSVNLPGSSWNAATGRITFSSDREDSDEIWTMAADGSDLFRVTGQITTGYAIEPSFSPDGQWIVFEFDDDVPDDEQQGAIWKVRANGDELTQLTDGADDRQPNWSPAKDLILFQRRAPGSDDWNLYTMLPDGSDIRQVTTAPSGDTDASWSPDGQWLVYSSDDGDLPAANIFVISAGGGKPARVTRAESRYDGAPSWSPDGRRIAFESYPGDEDAPSTLWLIAPVFK